MAKYDESDGVWRTVGGRRIFIRDGQSLSDAMKASGKFGKKQKNRYEELKEKQGKGEIESYSKEDYELRDLQFDKKIKEGLITKEDAEYEKAKQAWHKDEISREEFDKIREELESRKSGKKSMDEVVKDLHSELENTDGRKVFKLQEQRLDELAEKHGFDRDEMMKKLMDLRQKDLDDYEAKRKESGEPSSFEKREAQMYSNGKDSKSLSELRDEYIKSDEFSPNKPMKEWMKEKGYNKESSKDHLSQEEWEGRKRAKAELDRDTEYAKKQYEENGDKKLYDQRMKTIDKAKKELIPNKKEQGVQKLKDQLSGKNQKELLEERRKFEAKMAENYNDKEAKAFDEEYSRSMKRLGSIQSQQGDIEKASGLKVKQAFETDAYGTGKQDRFLLDDGRYISHSTESFGEKEDKWTVYENARDLKGKTYESYDAMIKDLGGSKNGSDKYSDYYKKENLGEPSNYQKGDKIEFNDGYYSTIKGTIVREATDSEKKHQINTNLKGYIVRDTNGNEYVVADTRIKGRGETDKAYKKAFEEYKKKHPNTKLSYGQFVDISEGK